MVKYQKRNGFLVQARMCATCIYRPGAPNDLKKLEADCADPNARGFFVNYRICHHSRDACCHVFWTRHKDKFALGQIAQRLGFVVFVQDDDALEAE